MPSAEVKCNRHRVAILDYELGNLFSIKNACEHVGLNAEITQNARVILGADALILPGVGAFGNAMQALHKKDLIGPLYDFVASGKPLLGICLGMQLLMDESSEFGCHKGLGFVSGSVKRFKSPSKKSDTGYKVPQVGWNHIRPSRSSKRSWQETLLSGLQADDYMYFVHSYYVDLSENRSILSETYYGNVYFCSALQSKNITAVQFHPERSGPNGIHIYQNLVKQCLPK